MRVQFSCSQLAWLTFGLLLLAAGVLPAAGEDTTAATAGTSAAPETIRWPSAVGEVVFPHLRHAEELGVECASCHHETVAANLKVPHPDYFDDFWVDCAVCHTGATAPAVERKCVACHPERAVGLNLEMPTVKVAIHRSCWGCHDSGTGAEASNQCGFCHQRPERPSTSPSAAAAK